MLLRAGSARFGLARISYAPNYNSCPARCNLQINAAGAIAVIVIPHQHALVWSVRLTEYGRRTADSVKPNKASLNIIYVRRGDI